MITWKRDIGRFTWLHYHGGRSIPTFINNGMEISEDFDFDERISCMVWKNLCIVDESSKTNEEEELTNLFHIKVRIKDKNVVSLFDVRLQAILISQKLMEELHSLLVWIAKARH